MNSYHNAVASQRRRLIIFVISTSAIFLFGLFHLFRTNDRLATDMEDEKAIQSHHIEYIDDDIITHPTSSSVDTTSATHAAPTQIGAIIAAARNTTNLTWMSEIYSARHHFWKSYPYNVDDPSPPKELAVPANKGHEAMVYLSWIIEHYDQLPSYVAFTHGHRVSWHQQGDMVDLIEAMRLPALKDNGYISFRCDWYPSCPSEIRPIAHDALVWGPGVNREATEYEIERSWNAFFPSEPLPETIASQCCAQFAVTKEAIQRRPKEDYERIRQWIVDSTLPDDVSGRVMEKLWAYIFTGEAVHCPGPQQCNCDYFGRCTSVAWPQTPEGLPDLPEP